MCRSSRILARRSASGLIKVDAWVLGGNGKGLALDEGPS